MSDTNFKKFQEAYFQLSQGISRPDVLAGMLWSKDFITHIEKQEAEHTSSAAYPRTVKLLEAVSKKIQLQPEKFDEFVQILKSEPSYFYLARLLSPGVQSPKREPQALTSTKDFSETDMMEWFKKVGLMDTDTKLLIDEGFGTGPGFMELSIEDINDMEFSRAGKKLLKKTLQDFQPGSQPVPMDTTPPQNAMFPIAKRPAPNLGAPPAPTPPPEPTTPDAIAIEIGMAPYALDTEFSDNYTVILAFAKLMPEWKPIAQSLHLSAQDIRAIETNVSLNYLMQCTETIKKWKSRFGFKAKYRMLIEAALAIGMENLAVNFCQLVQRVTGCQNQPRPPVAKAPTEVKALTLDSVLEELRPLSLSRSNNGQLSRGLSIEDYKLSEFEANNHYDIAQVRTEILNEWLKNDVQPNWQTLSRAIKKTGDGRLAWKLESYLTPVE